MGAKTRMLITSAGNACETLTKRPSLDRDAAQAYAQSLFPNETLSQIEDGHLSYTNPPDDQLRVGSYGDAKVLAAKEFGMDYPSMLAKQFIPKSGVTTLHAMHSSVDWFAFAHWIDGRLIRALSLSPDSGVLEDIGEHMEFEKPYWAGEFPAVEEGEEDEYPFDFHPLELAEAALLHFFGYQLEGYVDRDLVDPEEFPLLRFKRTLNSPNKPWWKVW